jgi:hypothetical protein
MSRGGSVRAPPLDDDEASLALRLSRSACRAVTFVVRESNFAMMSAREG